MKQIFDWLREQINAKIVKSPTNNEDWFRDECVRNNAYQNALDFINEAEAKWGAECCEWKKNIYFFGGHDYSSGCGTRIPLNSLEYHKYCPFCGKPIKISEVE